MSTGAANVFQRYKLNTAKKLGEGGYGQTYEAIDKETNEALAVKIIDTRRMKVESIKKECQILEVLTHPNVISVKAHSLGMDKHAHLYFIFMELAGGGELFDQVIERGANAMPESTARGFFNQIVDGLAYCHLAGVAHRDLKLENVLLTSKAPDARLKLIDFGLSHVYPRLADSVTVDRSKPLHDVCGSKSYAAPEVLGGRGYDGFAADMWSLGVCLFAMLSGFFPLDEASDNDWRFPKLRQMQSGGKSTVASVYSWYKRSAAHLTPEVTALLDGLLAIDPQQRLTMPQVREHPWVNQTKLGQGVGVGVGASDQGSYNKMQEVNDEAIAYRGFAMPSSFDDYDMQHEDEEPVYRSLGSSAAADDIPSIPAMGRQRAFSTLQGKAGGSTGFGAFELDDLA